VIVKPAQKLKRHILEGERRPMKQFHQPDPAVDLAQRRHRAMAETGISLLHQAGEIRFRDAPAQEGLHDTSSQGGIIKSGQGSEIELRPAFGQIKPAVPGEPGQQNFVEGQRRRGASGTEISQGTTTFWGLSEGPLPYRRLPSEARRPQVFV